MALFEDSFLLFMSSLQALFGHFFKGLIDHLVSNHRQLLSIERENHKVNMFIALLLLHVIAVHPLFVFFCRHEVCSHGLLALTIEFRCFNLAEKCTRTLRRDMMKPASANNLFPAQRFFHDVD